MPAQGRLAGKVAVITGTGDGQGRTAALRFAEEGAAVVGCDINEETAAETLRLVRESGGQMECLYPLDLTVESEVKRLMAHANDTFGRIDILYNNAMGQMAGQSLQITADAFDFTIRNTLTLGWLSTKHAVPYMGSGSSIVFIGSEGGLFDAGAGFPGNVSLTFPYAIAKAGVIRMSKLFAIDLAPRGIRVNCICPGPIKTPMTGDLYADNDSPMYGAFVDQMLVERIGLPEDIVNAAVYLSSDEASWVNAHNLVVDGGISGSGGIGAPDPEMVKTTEGPPYSEWLNHDA